MNKQLIVITGPTASGKTSLAVDVALHFGCDVISADSRQIYRGIPITTAVPTIEERRGVRHHLVEALDLDSYYSAAQFEEDALRLIDEAQTERIVVCGGSMMYVDALANGIDILPTISPEVRARAAALYTQGGLDLLCTTLETLDPDYYAQVDRNNTKRLVHAIEICLEANRPYSQLRTGQKKQRPFDIKIFSIDLPREQLFSRINRRVDLMIEQGMEQEARRVEPLRHLNSLNTVGFKELFACFDGIMDRPTAIERIKKNTRVYAKKQLTLLRRLPHIPLSTANPLLPILLSHL